MATRTVSDGLTPPFAEIVSGTLSFDRLDLSRLGVDWRMGEDAALRVNGTLVAILKDARLGHRPGRDETIGKARADAWRAGLCALRLPP